MARPVPCDRCGQPADAHRVDTSTLSSPYRTDWGRITCSTPGCVDETGSPAVDPPDELGQLTREDRRWLRRQRHLADEYAATAIRLLREVA